MVQIIDIPPAIVIFLIALAFAIFFKILRFKLTDQTKLQEFKLNKIANNKRMKELTKMGADGLTELIELRDKMLKLQMDMMKLNNKKMIISIPIFFALFLMLGFIYGTTPIETFIPLPSFNGFFLLNPFTWIPVGLTMTSGYHKIYFISYFTATLIIGIIGKFLTKETK